MTTVRHFLAVLILAVIAFSTSVSAQNLPPDGETATARLDASPRHGEWAIYDAGAGDEVQVCVSYPERSDGAPVVVAIHDIRAMSDWARAVVDQLAVDGFIAVTPDLLSGKGPNGGGTESLAPEDVDRAMRELDQAEVDRRLQAAAAYGTSLPAATDKIGSIGVCWGGSTSLNFAVDFAGLDAAVVYCGTSPDTETLAQIQAPVLGHYSGADNRVRATIPTHKLPWNSWASATT